MQNKWCSWFLHRVMFKLSIIIEFPRISDHFSMMLQEKQFCVFFKFFFLLQRQSNCHFIFVQDWDYYSPFTEPVRNPLKKASAFVWISTVSASIAWSTVIPRSSLTYMQIDKVFDSTILRHAICNQISPEWKVDLDGTFLGNADGCLEVLDADVKLFRFTKLLF